MHNITLDFDNPGLPQVLDVMQSDSQSRFIGITLYNGGVPYEAPSGAQYTVQYHGAGANNMGWYDTITLSSGTRKAVVVDSPHPNIVTLELAEQALQVNGNLFVTLCVVNNAGYMLQTFPIICRVNGAAFPDTVAVQSFFYVTGITSEQWLAYVTACQDAQKRAEDAAATFETDSTLSIEGRAADAAAVGNETWRIKNITYIGDGPSKIDLNKMAINTQVTIAYPKNLIDNLPNSPATESDYFNGSVLTFTGSTSSSMPAAGTIQLLFIRTATSTVFTRFTWNYPVEWTEWESISGFSGNGKSYIYNDGDSAVSLNNLKTNESYVFSYPTTLLTGLPDEIANRGGTALFTLQTFNFTNKQHANIPNDGALQMLTSAFDTTLWIRTVLGGSGQWLPWHGVGGFSDGQEFQNYDNPDKTLDLDTLPFNQLYTLAADYAYLKHAPTELAGLSVNGSIITFSKHNSKPSGANADAGSLQILYTFTTPNVLYIRNGWSYPAKWLDWHTIGANTPVKPASTSNYYAFSGLKNFTACGDSITVSLAYPSGLAVEVQSWAKILAKLNGTDCNVFAQGGLDTHGYLESNLYTNAISDTAQFAILFLGINDINNNIPVGSSRDIGTTNNTFYANYTKIINGLLQNHKFVFCISIPAALQHDIDQYNNAIKDICNNHIEEAFYADISAWSDSIAPFGNGHLSSVGYGELAGAIQNAIGDTMATNAYFRILDT